MTEYWIASGLLTHLDAVKACNEMIEDAELQDGGSLKVDCYYTKAKELRYGVKFVCTEDVQ